jgi:hypothetical protein
MPFRHKYFLRCIFFKNRDAQFNSPIYTIISLFVNKEPLQIHNYGRNVIYIYIEYVFKVQPKYWPQLSVMPHINLLALH